VEGRCDDFIKLSDNRIVSPPILWSIMKSIQGISEFQIVQEKEGELLVYIVGLTNSDARITSMRIDEEFKKILGGEISVRATLVDRIDREKSGKLRSVVSKI
jgi:phenylacetate-coenzyme A ligase PaaK-like adenylate-forming protein